MDMPYNLQTLPSEAIDILRYYAGLSTDSAHADSIVDGTGLSDRGFGKGIRRLVTKNYLVMASEQSYRITEAGRRVIEELKTYDLNAPPASSRSEARFLRRHVVIIAPRTLPANEPTDITVGFEEAPEDEYLDAPANMLLRLSVVNGEPSKPLETPMMLTNRHMQQAFQITAGNYTAARIRVEVCQYRDDSDEYDFCGGLYVDLPVAAEANDPGLAAYGNEVILKEE